MSLKKSEGLLIKLEVTPGVDAAPDPGVDGLLVEGLGWSHEGLTMHEQQLVTGFGSLKSVYAGHLKAITFSTQARPSGVAGIVPAEDAALQACGVALVTNVGVSNVYADAMDGLKTATIYYYEGVILHKLTHAVGKVSFKLDAQAGPMMEYTFIGHDEVVADVLPAITYDDNPPPTIRGAAFQIDGYSASISSLSIDLGNEVTYPKDMSSADGYANPEITNRNITLSIDPLAAPLGDYDWMAKLKSGDLVTVTTGVIGSVAGRRIQYDVSGAFYSEVSQSDREGHHARSISLGVDGLNGGFSVTYS